jgi:hypothetical protein
MKIEEKDQDQVVRKISIPSIIRKDIVEIIRASDAIEDDETEIGGIAYPGEEIGNWINESGCYLGVNLDGFLFKDPDDIEMGVYETANALLNAMEESMEKTGVALKRDYLMNEIEFPEKFLFKKCPFCGSQDLLKESDFQALFVQPLNGYPTVVTGSDGYPEDCYPTNSNYYCRECGEIFAKVTRDTDGNILTDSSGILAEKEV